MENWTWRDTLLEWFHRTYIPYWWRRFRWGFDPRDLWSLDHAMFKWLLPRLKKFKDTAMTCPFLPGYSHESLHDDDSMAEMEAEWQAILEEIIWTLEYLIENDWPIKGYDEEYDRVMRGYGLLIKWLPAMWD